MKNNSDIWFHVPYKCPLDNKECDYDLVGEDDPVNPMRGCRHKLLFNINTHNPPCGRDFFRKKKSSKPKSKRKSKKKNCGCK
jgi:hypothetical protein